MHAYRGRGGPSRNTPASVLCQKCLKRDRKKLTCPERHYSYECKSAPQERPYKARPSRTQQLLNPKLVPKLTDDVLDTLQRKKGVADEELAKKEAERARKRALDDDDVNDAASEDHEPTRRQRSISSDSRSSISARSAASPAAPPRREGRPPRRPAISPSRSPSSRSRSPSRSRSQSLSVSSRSDRSRSRSAASGNDDYHRRISPTPEEEAPREEAARQRRSPPSRHARDRPRRRYRDDSPEPRVQPGSVSRIGASDFFDDPKPQDRPRHDSRSPERSPTRDREGRGRESPRRYRDRDDGRRDRRGPPPGKNEPPRPRSLSPFSKRLALTQAMNTGR